MRLSKFSLAFLPAVTFFLGLLIGGLEGGLGDASNYGPILLYLVPVSMVWAALEWLARRHEDGTAARSGDSG